MRTSRQPVCEPAMVRLSAGWESTQGSRREFLPEIPQKAFLGFFI